MVEGSEVLGSAVVVATSIGILATGVFLEASPSAALRVRAKLVIAIGGALVSILFFLALARGAEYLRI